MQPGRLLSGVLKEKLTRDIVYTLGSFAVLALSGMVINLLITSLRDTSALGVFNQSYAVYIMVSQIATFGLHYSVLRHAALLDNDRPERAAMLFTASAAALIGGFAAAVLTYAGVPLFTRAFDSPAAGSAIGNAALGLCLFPLNKVLLSYLNALRHMRAYSLLQGARYASIMIFVAVLVASTLPIEYSTLAFAAAELITFCAAVIYLYVAGELGRPVLTRIWFRQHLQFGSKGLVAGMFAEFNSRVDVLLIGLFMSDRAVGVYSFAAMFADGVYHVLAMVRLNFNPLLVRAMRDRDWSHAKDLLRKSRRYVTPTILGLSILVIAAFWVLAEYLMPQKGLLGGLPSLVILLTGLVLVAQFVPFDNLLMVTGHPGYQTLQQLLSVSANVVFGILMLRWFDIEGVAAGTAVSYLTGVSALIVMSQRIIGWDLLRNYFRS